MSESIEEVLAGAATDEEVVADFSAAKDFTPPPLDWYDVKITEVVTTGKKALSKNGERKFVLTLKVTSGEHKGRQFFRHCMLEGGGAGFTKDALKELGVQVGDDKSLRFKPSQLLGWEGQAKIGPQDDNPKYDEVSEFRPTPSSAPII